MGGIGPSLWPQEKEWIHMSTTLEAAVSTPALTDDEARSIAVGAYLYFYPLVFMDLTRKQSINIDQREFGKGPMNTFVNVPAYPPADFKGVVRSNFDTLYSIAWLDLTGEPLVVSAPDRTGDYRLPMLDMWTDVSLARLADNRHWGLRFPHHPTRLGGKDSGGHHPHLRANSLCLGHRPYQDATERRTTMPCIRSRQGTKLRHCHVGGGHPSR